MMKPGPALALVAVIAGCGADPSRITLPPVETAQTVRVSVRSVEVTQVSLPLYAESEEIAVEAENGALTNRRIACFGLTIRNARSHRRWSPTSPDLTSAKIAAEPWPFDQFPDARLVVRFDRFLPKSNGQFEVSGQYYVARVNSNIRETARSFELSATVYARRCGFDLGRASECPERAGHARRFVVALKAKAGIGIPPRPTAYSMASDQVTSAVSSMFRPSSRCASSMVSGASSRMVFP